MDSDKSQQEVSTAGDHVLASAGRRGTAIAGAHGTASAGDFGKACAGDHGTAFVGCRGTASAGVDGVIIIEWHDGSKRRLAVGYIGEDGLQPGVLYRLDGDGNFVEAERESK